MILPWKSENTLRNIALAELTRSGHRTLVGVEVDLLGRRVDAILGYVHHDIGYRELVLVEVKKGVARAEAYVQLLAYIARARVVVAHLGLLRGDAPVEVTGILAAEGFVDGILDLVASDLGGPVALHTIGSGVGAPPELDRLVGHILGAATVDRCQAFAKVVEASGAWEHARG